jgi:hypothetical protein
VDAWTGKRARTVVWAHNLGYDVRISQALTILPRHGWTLEAHNLARQGAWFVWTKGDARLILVDSASVYTTTLAAVGKAFGMAKPPLPSDMDSDDRWLLRCRADVAILATAMKAYLRWVETEDLGNWQFTGAGQSWAAFRHRFMDHKLLVHGDEDALRAERRAMWTGRTEAYYHGRVPASRTDEWDLTLAYARIARDTPLPTKFMGEMPNGYPWERILYNSKVALLAECTVETKRPVVPASTGNRILWPVGRFTTVLWDCEIRALLRSGATVSVDRGWFYRTTPALNRWGGWIIDGLSHIDSTATEWQKLILKHWARALIGRFAMSFTQWDEFARAPHQDVRQIMGYDTRTGEDFQLTHIGDKIWRSGGVKEWANSMPAVTGYVMAECRVRMWEMMEALGQHRVLYCDTDSLMVSAEYHDDVAALTRTPLGEGLRLKKSWIGVKIYGPRQIITEGQVRVSGIPRGAVRVDETTFDGEVWESLTESARKGRPGEVRQIHRPWKLAGVDSRRIGPKQGWTVAVEVEPTAGGSGNRRVDKAERDRALSDADSAATAQRPVGRAAGTGRRASVAGAAQSPDDGLWPVAADPRARAGITGPSRTRVRGPRVRRGRAPGGDVVGEAS